MDAKGAKPPRLLHWHQVPSHLQFNPYILTGYRPQLSPWGSLRSLFYLHNETVNVITHGVPIVCILVVVPCILPWEELSPTSRFLAWCHVAGSVAPWVGSFIYHLFMNLHFGPNFYNLLLQVDMLGIWISQSFGALPMVFASVFCMPYPLQWFVIFIYGCFSIVGLFKVMSASSPWRRRMSFTLVVILRVLLCLLRCSKYGGGDPNSMRHLFYQDAFSIVGVCIGALKIPEKWWPGSLDLCFNSHNIMHIIVVMAVYPMHQSTVKDLLWMNRPHCCSKSGHAD
ncbi:progestin and adipoQ receptor family member 4-like [Nilaparvata lugens]|uniref:progestin and adipoQ receptor family member 4-like n=1 Tax=Nilaparvata lugens TaxID=108931 RepID=UPI00193E3A3C|nr:progestin and adipoQ receptor family member 4-like [Nilaparvata lugens]